MFHRQMWYRALSLRYACTRSSGIILIPCAKFRFFRGLHCWANYGKRCVLNHSITQPAYLMLREPKLSLRKMFHNIDSADHIAKYATIAYRSRALYKLVCIELYNIDSIADSKTRSTNLKKNRRVGGWHSARRQLQHLLTSCIQLLYNYQQTRA